MAAPCQQAYLVGSLHAALAVLIALWGRRRTGRGEYVDVPLQACLNAEENLFANYFGPDNFARRSGSQHRLATPGRVYPCADGFVYMFVSPGTDHWRRMLDWLGHPAELAFLFTERLGSSPCVRNFNPRSPQPFAGLRLIAAQVERH